MKSITQTITKKGNYWKAQEGKYIDRYIENKKVQDRDMVIRVRERIKVYNEILELTKSEGL